MKVNEALEIVKERGGRPREDDWELIDAAMVLAQEVETLRDLGVRAQAIITDCIVRSMPITDEVAYVRNNILDHNR